MTRIIQIVIVFFVASMTSEAQSDSITLSEEAGAARASGDLFPAGTALSSGFYLGYERGSVAADLSLGTLMWTNGEAGGENLMLSARILHFWRLQKWRLPRGVAIADTGAGVGAIHFRQENAKGMGGLLASALRLTLMADEFPHLIARFEVRGELASMGAPLGDKHRSAVTTSIRAALVSGVRF